MKPNPFGFNLNFDEFLVRPIWWGEAPKRPNRNTEAAATDLAGQRYRGIECAEPRPIVRPRHGLSELL